MDSSRRNLIKECDTIRLFEIQAKKAYLDLLPLISGKTDKAKLQHVIDDEFRHEQIAQQMIDILSA
jgi:rubrerythrin